MKKLLVLAGVAGVLYATKLQAAMTVTLQQDTQNYSSGSGGEFRVEPDEGLSLAVNYGAYASSTSDGSYFQTFSIETSESFSPGTTYNVSISTAAQYNGQGPDPGYSDPISIGTAWLYSQFAAGTLTGYDYTYGSGRSTAAGALQNAIWWLEGEGGERNAYIDLAETALGELFSPGTMYSDAQIIGDAKGEFGVRVLNLWDDTNKSGRPVQDQLVVVPETTTMVAGALLLLPFGVSTLRNLCRNRAV